MLKKLVFFVFITVIIRVCLDMCRTWTLDVDKRKVIPLIGAVVIFIATMILQDNIDHFVAPAVCRGGAYMHQGNSPVSKMCRDLEKTPEGEYMVAQYNCPGGFQGMPLGQFKYTANTDSNWNSMYECPQ